MSIEGEIDARELFDLWQRGMSPRRIAEETRTPVDVIYRLLRSLEKELTKEKGVENYGQEIHI